MKRSKTCGQRRSEIDRNGAVGRDIYGHISLHSLVYPTQFATHSDICKPPPYSISRTVNRSPPFGFYTGTISKVFRTSQLHLPTVSARMPTLQKDLRIWESCMRPIIHTEAPRRLSTTTYHLLDWVSQNVNRCSIGKCVFW